ncbi:MAG TPA: permease [Elusimicrobia bacterium]|nr:MAG: permease [Elusimicrobia bacterium GWA2_66_18]HAZ07433.1 permease [Elusimicrobiota bacterium]
MVNALSFVFLGLVVGVLSGMVGVGGGIILVPVLVLFYGFSQHMAQGTSTVLLLPPIGILAAYTYYKNGYVDVRAALLICAGFVLGGLFGAKIAVALPRETLRRGFGALLLLVSARMIFGK